MPHFRLLKDPPEFVNFRNGQLYFNEYSSAYGKGVWNVSKGRPDPSAGYHLLSGSNLVSMQEARRAGFEVVDAIPLKVMEALVRLGVAMRMD